MDRYTMSSPLLLTSNYPSHHGGYEGREERLGLEVEKELIVLKEWAQVQRNLLNTVFVLPPSNAIGSWRSRIAESVCQSTQGHARIWWKPPSNESVLKTGQLVEIRYKQTCYGMLELAPGYLVSHLVPDLHQTFGHLCALLISFTEHQVLVCSLLEPLQSLEVYNSLTPREKEVLRGMAAGESENTTAQRLHIALTTVRTHRHNVYRSLEVHSPQDAVLRSFALRIIDWLDLSNSPHTVVASSLPRQKAKSKR